ncbi:MAG: circularly permuted type 2 ATP-grasp protein [Magnetococcales bacterium]|nr:circularly permuted type 2 ATP-grasp protein [Magnetococcales bacterium]
MTGMSEPGSASYDEAFAAPAEPRGHWRQFFDHLYAGGPDRPGRLWDEARHLLRESGAVYAVAAGKTTQRRPWPFDPIPLILDGSEWQRLEAGLIQRHHLLNLLLRDLYGMQRVLAEGILPPELIYGSDAFLFPLWGGMARKVTLSLYAADLVRLPDGRFHVVSDRTQAPSGHGYALQNRRLSNRLYPSRTSFGPVQPLQPFYRGLRNALTSLTPQTAQTAHIVLMTPGPANETHFEHTLLAHSMGLTLAQGNDMTVRNGRLCLKTLGGLLPVDVVLRRVDEAWCDPLELREDSLLGVVGLVQVVREGHTVMANPLGSGILENLGLHPFMPQLCRFFLGETLHLENPETLWLGHAPSLRRVLDSWHDNYSPWAILPLQPDYSLPVNGLAHDQALRAHLATHPSRYVARSLVQPSQVPGIDAQGMCRRHLLLRAFLHHDGNNSLVMPGGLARVSPSAGSDVLSSQGDRYPFSPAQGGSTKDVWILGAKEQPFSESSSGTLTQDLAAHAGLPSRVAENLFWMGRYAERSESVIRLFREATTQREEEEFGLNPEQRRYCRNRLLTTLTHVTGTYPGFTGADAQLLLTNPDHELRSVLLDLNRVGSLAFSLQALIQAGFSLRDRLSSDTWGILDNISTHLGRWQRHRTDPINHLLWDLGPLLQGLTALAGLTWENMIRDQGWLFLDLGRRLERAMFLAQLLESCLGDAAPHAYEMAMLERLLALNDGLESFRLHFQTRLEIEAVLAKLLQDDTDPRSLVFQLTLMEAHARQTPRSPGQTLYRTALGRTVFESLAAVRLADADMLARVNPETRRRDHLMQLTERIRNLLPMFSETASNNYFRHADSPYHLFTVRNS